MTKEEIKKQLQNQIEVLQRKAKVPTLEVINWINDLIKEMDKEPVVEKPVQKEVKVEVEEKEEKKVVKSK